MPSPNIRLPAEWENQEAILLAWPDTDTDWAHIIDDVQNLYLELIGIITQDQAVVLAASDAEKTGAILNNSHISTDRLRIYEVPINDTWTRDFGPITVLLNAKPVLLDFVFNGWGLKFAADKDNCVTRNLKQAGAFSSPLNTIGLVLEGGSIESDGTGTILTTSQCLLSPNRNPQLDKHEIEGALTSLLGAKKVLWLDNGHLAGDDTDSHVDTLARLCPGNTILYQSCNDPDDEHFEDLMKMKDELAGFTSCDGSTYKLIPLPWPKAKYDNNGKRLPATYANFLITNRTVLVPVYSDPSDDEALSKVAEAFPDRNIKGINCLPLIMQHGSLHCITMQIPVGVLS